MRISTVWSQQSSLNSILQQQVNINDTQSQLSSGKRLLQPSDDPVSASRILAFKDEINQTNQYQRNIDTARERNITQESSIESAENILFRARELTIQAATDTLNNDDRLTIKHEIDQLLDNLLGIANTQNANGEYIFSGYLSNTKPFEFDTQLDAYEYLGGEQQRLIQISPERRIADGEPGYNLFQEIQSTSQEASAADGKRSIFNTLSTLSDALANQFSDPQASIQGSNFIETPVDLTGSSFDIVSELGTTISVSLTGTFNSIDEIKDAINATTGLSSAGIEVQSNGNHLEFVSLTTGASSTIAISNIAGSFGTVAGFSNGDNGSSIDLTTNDTGELFFTITDEILTDLDNALDSFLQARTAIGSRLKTMDNQEIQNEKFILDLQTTLSNIEDLDYAEAIIRFNTQDIALQAAQQSFTRVQNLSLFNFL